MLSEQEQDRFAVSMACWRLLVVVLTAVVVLLLGELFASKAHAGCKQVAAVQIQTQFIAVPVATPLGLPVYAQPVAQAGLVAYGSAGAAAKSEAVSREAKSVVGPVPPSPDGKPYELYLREWMAYAEAARVALAGITPQATAQQATPAAAAQPEQTLVQQHCVSCHNPTKKDGGLDLTGELTPTIRLKSVFRLNNDTAEKPAMPKGKLLTNDQRGELVRELTGNP